MSALEPFSKQKLELFRQKTDPLADAVISAYFPQNKQLLNDQLEVLQSNADRLSDDAHSSLKEFEIINDF